MCGGSIIDKYSNEFEELIEKFSVNDSHHLHLSHHSRNVEPKREGVLNVKGLGPTLKKTYLEKDLEL